MQHAFWKISCRDISMENLFIVVLNRFVVELSLFNKFGLKTKLLLMRRNCSDVIATVVC